MSYTEQAVESQTFTSCTPCTPCTPCAEFPNDNPALHHGAIWRCGQVTGAAECESPEVPFAESVEDPGLAVLLEVQPVSAPEIDLVLEEAVAAVASVASAVAAEPPTDEAPPVLEDEVDDIEIVDELAFDGVVDESPEPGASSRQDAEPGDDPFVALGAVLEAVARGAGAGEGAIATLRMVLGRERVTAETSDELLVLREQAAAWQGILRGDSEDFGACGVPSLDEWAAGALARAMGEMSRADGLRRELRRRGVAAFGLVIEAA